MIQRRHLERSSSRPRTCSFLRLGVRVLLLNCLLGAAPLLAQEPPPAPSQPPEQVEAERFHLNRSEVPQIGDRWRTVIDMRTDVVLTLTKGRTPLRVESKREGHEVKWIDHLRAEDSDGVKLLRTYELVHDWATGVKDTEPRKVWFRWDGNKLDHEVEGGEALPELAQRYVETEEQCADLAKKGVYDQMYPDEPVPVGFRWQIKPEVGAMLADVDPKDLDLKKTSCTGYFEGTRRGKQRGSRWLRIRIEFNLCLSKIGELSFTKGGVLKLHLASWVPARGRSGRVESKVTGSLEGVATHESWPKGVSAKVEASVEGLVVEEPLPRAAVD